MSAPTGTPVCLIEKINGARRSGVTRARMWELAGVETEAAPSSRAPSGNSHSCADAVTSRLDPMSSRATWLTRSGP